MNDDEHWVVTFLIQTKALLWKNYLVFYRKMQVLLFLLFTPYLAIYLLGCMRSVGDNLEDFGLVENAISALDGSLQKCNTGYRPSSFGYVSKSMI